MQIQHFLVYRLYLIINLLSGYYNINFKPYNKVQNNRILDKVAFFVCCNVREMFKFFKIHLLLSAYASLFLNLLSY